MFMNQGYIALIQYKYFLKLIFLGKLKVAFEEVVK